MICPMCLGKGYATDEDIKEYPHRCPNCNGKGFYSVDWQKVRCEVCNGSGKKPMTNEEYLKSCTTEMLAVAIFRAICTSAEMIHCEITLENRSGTELKEAIYEWLKEKHDGNMG